LTYSKNLEYVQLTERINYQIKKLQTSEFHLMVIGQFKRGKSTIINYLIGENVLPTGVVPITSIITRMRYGQDAKVEVVFNDGTVKTAHISDIELFVSEVKNPENKKGVKLIEVEYPSDNLKNGLVLIDTPGFGNQCIKKR